MDQFFAMLPAEGWPHVAATALLMLLLIAATSALLTATALGVEALIERHRRRR